MPNIVDARGPYIDGKYIPGDAGFFSVEDPTTEQVIADAEASSSAQFEHAILAARQAFDEGPWPAMPARERAAAILRFGDALTARRGALIETAIAEVGSPRMIAEYGLVGFAIKGLQEFAELFLQLPEWEHNEVPLDVLLAPDQARLSMRRYEPVGVVAAITAYNGPFLFNIWKLVPALLSGCTTVLRPSPLTPLEAFALGEAADEAGLPAGVLNIVAESGSAGATLLTSHPAVDMVSFTGSVPVGHAIAVQAAPTLKRLVLELGGKSVQLHLPDTVADSVDSVVSSVVGTLSGNAGQACVLQSRVLVPQEKKSDVLAAMADAVPKINMGDPRDPGTRLGPLITSAHRQRVSDLVQEGIDAGARLIAGGPDVEVPERGWFYPATVLDVDDNSNPVARREVFGPVVTVHGYGSIDEAVSIANDTEFGLSNAVYGSDLKLGMDIASKLRSGEVRINDRGPLGIYNPAGGYKQSGIGRERGVAGLRSFQEIKHIVVSGAK
jgi:acyl-CoA reductase-like NAD-dependent aldehyde dehydrogenase